MRPRSRGVDSAARRLRFVTLAVFEDSDGAGDGA
jgi:hypothetical protein